MNENKLTQDYSIFRKEMFNAPEFAAAMKELQLKFDLADAVLHARIQRGLSQTALAKAIGTRQANISRIEAGLGNPTIELIQRLVSYLDLEVKISAKTSVENDSVSRANDPLPENIAANIYYSPSVPDLMSNSVVNEKPAGYRRKKA